MAIIINCDKCNKQMGSLEPHKVLMNQYVCLKCAASIEAEIAAKAEDSIVLFYQNVDLRNINDFCC